MQELAIKYKLRGSQIYEMHSIWNSMIDMTNSLIDKSYQVLNIDKNDPMYKNKNSLLVINNILNNLAIKSFD